MSFFVYSLTFSICAGSSMCGKCKYRFHKVICNGYNRTKAIEFDGGKTEMWEKFITSNIGATRIEEVSNAFGLKSDICSSNVSA